MINGTLTIPAGYTLELRPGAEIDFPDNVVPVPKIVVAGRLKLMGSATARVRIGATAAPGGWEGIDVLPGGEVTARFADIQNADTGIDIQELSTQFIEVRDCTFLDNFDYDMRIVTAAGLYSSAVVIDGNQFHVGVGTGLHLEGCFTGASVTDNTFLGTGGGGGSTSGLYFDGPGQPSSPLITGNTFSGFTSGQGAKLGVGNATLRGNTFTGNKYGAFITGGTHTFAPATGYELGNSFTSNSSSGATISGSGASPTFRRNLFHANFNGAVAQSGATPSFGDSEWGDNSFLQSASKCLWNRTSGVTISAARNYWDVPCEPWIYPLCAVGLIQLVPALCTSPLSGAGPGRGSISTEVITQRSLSMSRSIIDNGVAEFTVRHDPAPWTELGIYDVLGRNRARVPLQAEGGSQQLLRWPISNSPGGSVASGIYFATLSNGNRRSEPVRFVVLEKGGSR
jgi:hypothetical protein